jgi:hypothetical protein
MNKKRLVLGGVVGVVAAWLVLCQLVIIAAEHYSPGPDVACAMVQQRAIHKLTGAVHVFSSCIPPGWESF